MNRAQLLQRLDSAWEGLKAAYAGLSDSQMVEPGVSDGWSVKDLIAHVTWWEEEALTYLPMILADEQPPRYSVKYGGINAFNALMTEQTQDLSLAEVLERRDETHQRLIAYIETVPEEHFARETRFRHRLRLDTYSHYRQHAEAIRKWREERERAATPGG